jgi:cytochrome c-type biogenesis protein CcmE
MPKRFVFLAIGVAALALAFIAASGINDNLVYYWTPTQLRAAGDKAYGSTIRLGGMVSAGSIKCTTATGVEFDIKDAGAIVHVKTSGVPPQMFRDHIGVVVEGTMTRSGTFESHRLMVSHNNEYRTPKGHPK